MSGTLDWENFQRRYFWFDSIRLGLDFSRTTMPLDYAVQKREMIERAFEEMRRLEAGEIANPDENRMVGHYWLRNPALAPRAEICEAIERTLAEVKAFVAEVHSGRIVGTHGPFKNILLIGIGGSALGPQFVAHALSHPRTDRMAIHFVDNTDPDGIERVFARLDEELGQTLTVVISKSGGTKETRNGMLEAEAAYEAHGLDFSRHAVAVTGEGSELDRYAAGWLKRFPMWDWVGGRTSETSAVGLLPAALEGFDVDRMLEGARDCDNATREHTHDNPAALIALYLFYIGNGSGDKSMVVLPYKDRLELFAKYLQQLVMESLGKRLDRHGRVVHQGLSVYGNKGSTDQHAYVQQLRDGLANFFCVFVGALKDGNGSGLDVEPHTTSGDYLNGFRLGTRDALFEAGRESVTINMEQVDEYSVGALIALFERVVGLYASFINVNAYHQPGVEAGKKAAADVLRLQASVLQFINSKPGSSLTVEEIARAVERDSHDRVFAICQRLAANGRLKGLNPQHPTRARFGI